MASYLLWLDPVPLYVYLFRYGSQMTSSDSAAYRSDTHCSFCLPVNRHQTSLTTSFLLSVLAPYSSGNWKSQVSSRKLTPGSTAHAI